MSKPTYLRDDTNVPFIRDTRLLLKHTIIKCSNETNFAKRYRWCVTQKIAESATEMYANMKKANSIRVRTAKDYELRRYYQKKAFAEVVSLTGLIDIAYEVFSKLDSDEIKYWTGLCANAATSLKNWIDSDYKSYKGL